MKKNTKSKIVLFSVIGLAAISIGTVGFATWVTGLDKKTESVNTTITVDTASNKTCYVEAVLGDNSISLTEDTTDEDSLITIEGTKYATDLTITFTKIKVIVSSESYIFNSLDFSLAAAESNAIVGCTYETNGVAPTELYGGTTNSDKKSYFDIVTKSYTASDLVEATEDGEYASDYVEGYDTYVATNLVFTFKWGTLFGGDKPSKFYTKDVDVTKNLQTSATATKVLNHMHECLSGKSVKLNITAKVADRPAGA